MTTGRSGIELDQSGEDAAAKSAARPLSTPASREPSLARTRAWLGAQAALQADRWTLWLPVALGAGAAVYFGLRREPLPWVAIVALGVAAVIAGPLRSRAGARWVAAALMFLAAGLAGFGLAKVREMRVKAPVAAASPRPQSVEAWVVDIASPGEGGRRLLLAPIRIGDWPPAETPIRIRVTLKDSSRLPAPGEAIRILAVINAPPPPASPGAYDFARDAFFESIGGVGFALGDPRPTTAQPPPWRLRLTLRVNALRWALAQRIVDTLGPETGGLAAAMTTGHEAYVPRAQVDDLRAAGLAHIISISGLHMAIVGGFAFAMARLLIALWPWLALRIPGKKAAALTGLAAVLGYLALSGAPPPAERAAITAVVAFAAILVDRQAISLHSLAIAALAILVLQPEAVTEPGFQMSFAATAALVALAEAWPRPVKEINTSWPIRVVQAAGVWIAASIAASFIAGMATGPFAMQHFNRVSTWGLAANLAVAPISSFIMMPALALGAALTPLGLGELPLRAAGFAIGLMTDIAHLAARAPHATFAVASAPAWTLPAAFLGILWLCLWRGPLRLLGLPLALAVSLTPRPPAPDAWVAADGAAVAVREGKASIFLRPDVKLFGAEFWSRRRGLEVVADEAERDRRFDCDRWSCAPRPETVKIAAAWNVRRPLGPGRLDALCRKAEVLVLRGDLDKSVCPTALVLNAAAFAEGGSAELYRTSDGWRVVWAQDLRGRRPWTWGPDPRP